MFVKKLIQRDNGKIFIDPKTGEVVEYSESITTYTQEQLERRRKYFEKRDKLKKPIKNRTFSKQGNFILLVMSYPYNMFFELDTATMTRLLYLFTYMNYDGVLCKDNRNKLTKEGAYDLLKLKRSTFLLFFNDLLRKNFITNENDEIQVNKDMFFKGKIKKVKDRISFDCYVKIYIDPIRQFYEKEDVRKHKLFGKLYKLIPYVSFYYNIICHMPGELEYLKIKPLIITEIADKLGYTHNHVSRLVDDLFNIKFETEGITVRVIGYLSIDGIIHKKALLINPFLYYTGNLWGKVAEISNFNVEEQPNTTKKEIREEFNEYN